MVLYTKALSPAAKFDPIAPAPYEPRSANAPVMVIAPATVSFVEGLVIPIPTLPEESMRMRSMLLVLNTTGIEAILLMVVAVDCVCNLKVSVVSFVRKLIIPPVVPFKVKLP